MKNIGPARKIRLILICLSIIAEVPVHAQFQYVFQQSTGTYQTLSGGTVLATATGSTGAAALDNVTYLLPVNSIPFPFSVGGISYTNCWVSSNGFIAFGGTSLSTTNTNPISSTSNTYTAAASVFGRDMIGNFLNLVSTNPDTIAQLRYGVTGSSPNRRFVVEWLNFRPNSSTAPNASMSFQVRLAETTNNIELLYGPALGTPWTSGAAQVGLRGATNAVFLNRISTSSWIGTTAGTVNTASVSYSTTNLPPSGLMFTYVAPCPAPTSLALTDAQLTGITLRWSSGSPNGTYTGSSYRVEWGVSGFTLGTGTVVNTTDTFLVLTGLTQGTNYQYYVSRDCNASGNGLSTTSGPRNFTTAGPGELCNNAISLPVASSLATCSYTVVNSGISQNGPNALCSDNLGGNFPDDDVWYKFTAPSGTSFPMGNPSIVITSTAGTNNDWVMELWKSCPGTPGAFAFKCADDVNSGMPQISLCQDEYSPGQEFYIRLWTYSLATSGTMNLCAYLSSPCPIAPPYDDCAQADTILINPPGSCPGVSETFTTLFATASGIGGANGAAPSCDANTTIEDVWLTFNTGSTGPFNLNINPVSATGLRAQLLFECGSGGIELQCFNPANGTYAITGLNPSAYYVLRIWSPPGQGGTFNICLQDQCDDPTAVISGSATICPTGNAQIRVDLTGIPPWNFTYSNGTSNFSVTTSTTPYFINVAPTQSTTYTLLSVSSSVCSGTVSGNAFVSVIPPPTVTLAPFTSSVCSNQILILNNGSPIGGSYSGPGVSGGQFNASLAGVGVHNITYTFGVGSGCARSATQPVTVIQGPSVSSFAPLTGSVGSTVTINGSGFVNVNRVRFNQTNAVSFTVVNSNTITAVVPSGATTGVITVTNSNNCTASSALTFGVGNPVSVNLNVKVLVEGFYAGGGLMSPVVDPVSQPTKSDTLEICLHQPVSPFGLVTSRKVLVNTNGTMTVSFGTAQLNNSYYVVVKGRNIVETWSKSPVTLISSGASYDFTVPGSSLRRANVLNRDMKNNPGNSGQ